MKAIVKEIQVGGGLMVDSLEEACQVYPEVERKKILFVIQLPNKEFRTITIRDEGSQVVAYGDFDGLPSFLDYANEKKED